MEDAMTTRAKMRKILNKAVCNAAPGFYSDVYWEGQEKVVQALREECDKNNWTWWFQDVYYGHEEGLPVRKTWQIIVSEDDKVKISGVIVAAGCGSVKDPLERYDIVAYF